VNVLEDRRLACRPDPIITFSGMSSRPSDWVAARGSRLGEDAVVVVCEGARFISPSVSLSLTCRMTSASRLTSVSTGATSSRRAARMRAKFFVFGFGFHQYVILVNDWVSTYQHITPPGDCPSNDIPSFIHAGCDRGWVAQRIVRTRPVVSSFVTIINIRKSQVVGA